MEILRANNFRDTWCGSMRAEDEGKEIVVSGWVNSRRDHGNLIFIDLRDRSGILQLVFNPESVPEAHALAHDLRDEHVISARGQLHKRSDETINPDLDTGEVELMVEEAELLAAAETPPFEIEKAGEVEEVLRLKYRYLDLRREGMRETIELRHRMTDAMRARLNEKDFIEVETPVLTKSTPEGARDFLVPSRLQPGSWYALPQSPQLFKQLLMVAGFERYYQVARCFRDEDLRADRQPDFTQLDLEMSFVGPDDVIEVIEDVMVHALAEAGISVEPPFQRISYDDAIARYGSDCPDIRYGLQINDLGQALEGTEFKVFNSVLESGGVVRGINCGSHGELSRAELDGLIEFAKDEGAKGLVWAYCESETSWRSPIAKFLSEGEIRGMNEALSAADDDLILIVADDGRFVPRVLAALRKHMADKFDQIPAGEHKLCWVVDWPLFEWDDDEDCWHPLHHPFTAPTDDSLELLETDPGATRAHAYDIVLDGVEIGGGSIRINQADIQRKVFSALAIGEEDAEAKFGFLLEALKYGAPPHGGIALGIDRIVAITAGLDSIRDVIAFPKTASGTDPMTGAPAQAEARHLKELGIHSTGKTVDQ